MTTFSSERAFVILLGSYIGLSGYAYTNLNYYHLEQNDSIRGLITVILIGIVLGRLIFLRSIIISKKTFIIATPFIYMSIVGLMRSDGLEFAGSFSRWLFYLLVMIYFAQSVARQHFTTLVVTLSFFFIVAGFGDLILERALHINQAARIGGSVGSPIGFASAVYCCSISLAWIWIAKRQKLFMITALTLCALNFATGTRSVAAGNLFALFAMWWMSTRDIGWKIVICIVICVVTAIFFDIFLGNTDVGKRIQLLFDYGSDSSFLNRDFILNIVGDRLTAIDLIFGVGGGRFPAWFYDNTGILNMAPHFEIIWLLVEGGIIGSVLYIIAMSILTFWIIKLRILKMIQQYTAVYLVIMIWSQQTVLQFANPMFFYQGMVVIFSAIGALFLGSEVVKDSIKKVLGKKTMQCCRDFQKTTSRDLND